MPIPGMQVPMQEKALLKVSLCQKAWPLYLGNKYHVQIRCFTVRPELSALNDKLSRKTCFLAGVSEVRFIFSPAV
jgi:hypothetical protein